MIFQIILQHDCTLNRKWYQHLFNFIIRCIIYFIVEFYQITCNDRKNEIPIFRSLHRWVHMSKRIHKKVSRKTNIKVRRLYFWYEDGVFQVQTRININIVAGKTEEVRSMEKRLLCIKNALQIYSLMFIFGCCKFS